MNGSQNGPLGIGPGAMQCISSHNEDASHGQQVLPVINKNEGFLGWLGSAGWPSIVEHDISDTTGHAGLSWPSRPQPVMLIPSGR